MANLTTAEQAARIGNTVNQPRLDAILRVIAAARANPAQQTYLTWPEIIIGLANGRIGPKGLARRLDEMEAADNGEFDPDAYHNL